MPADAKSSDLKATVAVELSKVLADSYAVYQKTHGYHWNVKGPNFRGLHLLFEEQYNEMWTALDEIAERIRALGELAPMGNSAFGNLSSLKEGDPTLSAEEMLKDLKASQKQVIATLQLAEKAAEDAGDGATQDLCNARLAAHQKHLWMIKASLG
ncbi:MAG: Dps family protein [Asticcacaulis sp.]